MEEPKYIENFSTAELEAELEHRKNKIPDLLPHFDWRPVEAYAKQVVECLSVDILPKDFENRLMELVMEAMYGREIWPWWTKRFGG